MSSSIVRGTFTIASSGVDGFKRRLARHYKGAITLSHVSYFKIGEGGYQWSGGVKVPAAPSAARTKLVSDGDSLTNAITCVNGSPAVTGSGFLAEVQPYLGQPNGCWIRLDADLWWHKVQSVTDDNNLVLTGNYSKAGGAGAGSVIHAGIAPDAPLYTFKKAIVPAADITFIEPNKSKILCLVAQPEANQDEEGNDPEFFEIGIYDADDVMLCYVTFPKETKNITVNLTHNITFVM